jgi:hypothetical protein
VIALFLTVATTGLEAQSVVLALDGGVAAAVDGSTYEGFEVGRTLGGRLSLRRVNGLELGGRFDVTDMGRSARADDFNQIDVTLVAEYARRFVFAGLRGGFTMQEEFEGQGLVAGATGGPRFGILGPLEVELAVDALRQYYAQRVDFDGYGQGSFYDDIDVGTTSRCSRPPRARRPSGCGSRSRSQPR